MERTLSHLAPAHASSGSLPADGAHTTRKLARAGAHSPGSSSRGRSGLVANDVPAQSTRARQLEGVLSKYTNLIQGWQNRYFVLDPDLSQLQYFVNEQGRGQKPRGTLPLIGASVTPSDETPHMFIVSSANGELFKLRAVDVKEQQLWMTQLQACTRPHSDGSTKVRKLKDSEDHLYEDGTASLDTQVSSGRTRSFSLLPHIPPSSSPGLQRHLGHGGGHSGGHGGGPSNIVTITHHKSPAAARRAKQQYPGRLLEVREVMSQAEAQQRNLVQSIEELPRRGSVSCLDQDLLLLKATSAATLSCLGDCLSILQHSHAQTGHAHARAPPSDGAPVWTIPKSPSADCVRNGGATPMCSTGPSPLLRKKGSTQHTEASVELVSPSEEVTDTEDNVEEELGVLEDQRSVILHLLSQLKLGMDLTRVVLPTFILEKRSLLEMYANFMAHPDMFLAISMATTPEERMVRFVEYYLTAFHEGRKGAVAKKPYNPILGETFHCSWAVPRDKLCPLRTHGHPIGARAQEPDPGTNQEAAEAGQGSYRVRFVAEQVSHHPPVSAFYCECRERAMCVNTHVWTKSKFMGMSVGVSMVGEGVLSLLDHGEEYVFTLPCAYARSILTVPWVELGGKVSITCAKSGYSATVTFHTKPFYGGKVHRVTAEVKQNSTGTIVCRAQGEWNGMLEFTYSSSDSRVMDTATLPVIRKRIRPLEKQGRSESRNLWQHVTRALKEGNMDAATEHKHHLEEGQRAAERQRAASGSPWKPKYFTKQGDGWIYNKPLWETY
ncbi:oxysterol-binding protein-related protein 10 isoform X2 [Electrophorus electricus]|uniref:Oxysterol-binding protein n=1 Tax=Electrophorus electricus TaxID=8005 RepID=A0A4W4GIB7_ELEEL|nr:oxysterol-binding protein-related protein 10 isoform X2 [Electrophorus electricus]